MTLGSDILSPVSSKISLMAASSNVSPNSRCPPGIE
jgi:hypothetical protein